MEQNDIKEHYKATNKTVLDIVDEDDPISIKLVEYWNKNYDVDFKKLRETYK